MRVREGRVRLTDDELLDLFETLSERPRLTRGNQQYIHIDGAVMEWVRVGTGERWSLAPSSSIYTIEALPTWWPREVLEWAHRAEALDFVRHAGAMSARTL